MNNLDVSSGGYAMNENTSELKDIITKFAGSGWDLIEKPAKAWLAGENCKDKLITAVKEADEECGSCGCEFDPLYKRFLALKDLM
jgi:hypothetical protein